VRADAERILSERDKYLVLPNGEPTLADIDKNVAKKKRARGE